MGTIMRAQDEFDSLGHEHEQKTRKASVSKRKTLDWLLKGFEVVLASEMGNDRYTEMESGKLKEVSGKLLNLIPYTIHPYDIKDLAVELQRYDDSDNYSFGNVSGAYLNACIQKCKDRDIELPVRDYSESPIYIGEDNDGKNILVNGDVGYRAGFKMRKGKLEIEGNADDVLGGEMTGGTIVVEGDAFGSTGCAMRGGLIVVRGDLGYFESCREAGQGMTGGEIRLYGNTKDDIYEIFGISVPKGGNIYWKDKPIVADGRFIDP